MGRSLEGKGIIRRRWVSKNVYVLDNHLDKYMRGRFFLGLELWFSGRKRDGNTYPFLVLIYYTLIR